MQARPPTSRPPAAWSAAGTSTTAKSDSLLRGAAAGARDPLRYVFESSVHVKRMQARPPTSSPAGGVVRGGHLDDGEERLALARRGGGARDPLRYVFESSVHVKRMQARPPTSRPAGGVKKCKGKRKACASLASKKKCHKSKYHNFCKWSYKKTKCRKVKCKEIGGGLQAVAQDQQEGLRPDGRPTGAPTSAPTTSPTAAPRRADLGSTTSPAAAPRRADLGSRPARRPPHDQPDARAVGLSDARGVDSARRRHRRRGRGDWSGISVSLSADGTTLAVGAYLNDGAGSWAGHARVFAWDPVDETWKQRGDDIDGEAAGDESGISVSLSADGTALAVGAVYNDGAGSSAGHARVFAWDSDDETWKQRGDDIDGEAADDRSGYSVSLSADGTTLAVGAPYNDGAGSSAGHARVFAWDPVDDTWIQRGDDIDGEAAGDESGWSVSLSADGATLAVGASGNDGAGSSAGHARVFAWDSDDDTWIQRGDDIDGEAADDWSGYSVSLSADGTTLAAWKQRGDDIDGEAAGDESGYSVSLSADGTALAVGASGTTAPASRATRRVRVGLQRRTWIQRGDDIDGEAAYD
ncbi:hypothetical protein JL722_9771 [Aureococcus anophagefferens]|nr:hypothetical protein JL722_9771 [Aureococcus anophagefferens]